jgi:hypothetical protein
MQAFCSYPLSSGEVLDEMLDLPKNSDFSPEFQSLRQALVGPQQSQTLWIGPEGPFQIAHCGVA